MTRSVKSEKSERPEARFRDGQVVVLANSKHEIPFKIRGVIWEDGWFYGVNRKNFVAESMIRELTEEDIRA